MDSNQLAMARWVLDKTVKNFLVACWRRREDLIGCVQVRDGILFISPAVKTTLDVTGGGVGDVSTEKMERYRPIGRLGWRQFRGMCGLAGRDGIVLLFSSCGRGVDVVFSVPGRIVQGVFWVLRGLGIVGVSPYRMLRSVFGGVGKVLV